MVWVIIILRDVQFRRQCIIGIATQAKVARFESAELCVLHTLLLSFNQGVLTRT